MPKRLSQFRGPIGFNLNNVGDYVLRDRERLARCALEGIASFSTVESWLLELFVDLVGGNRSDAATIFLTLESRGARSSALAPFVSRLPHEQQELYHSIMRLFKIRAGERDRLAHWIWGASQQLPDALLLANPKAIAALDPFDPEYRQKLAHEIWAYGDIDFSNITEANNQLAGFGFKFRWVVTGHPANAEGKLYRELCEAPVLADILRHRAERAKTPQQAAE